jgi:bifunctional non-homologous end joining protein LigD
MKWDKPSKTRRSLGFIEPCIPTVAAKVPEGPMWVHEIKHDGYRLIVRRSGDRVRLFTRGGYEWSDRYPRIVEAAKRVRGSFVIDGEAVVPDKYGIADFEKLHSREHDKSAMLWAFDLQSDVIADTFPDEAGVGSRSRTRTHRASCGFRMKRHSRGSDIGGDLFRAACNMSLEDIVSKRLIVPNEARRLTRYSVPNISRWKSLPQQ